MEKTTLDSEDTPTPMDLVVLVPVYCPDTDNIYPIVVRQRHGQNLSPQKSQLFTDFIPRKETVWTINIIIATHPLPI